MTMSQPDKHASGAMARETEDDVTRCFACGEALKKGELVMHDASEAGLIHAACCGPEREAYHGDDDGPLKDDEPIPTGWPWPGDEPALSAISAPEPQREGLAGRLAELSAKGFHNAEFISALIAAYRSGALALHATSQPLPQEGGRVPEAATVRKGVEAMVAALDAPVPEGCATYQEAVVRAVLRAAAPQPPLPSGAPDALAALNLIEAKCELARSIYATEARATPCIVAECFLLVRDIARAAIAQAEADKGGDNV